LAVLLACQRAAQARGCALQVVGLPPKAQQLAKVYGVAPWL
jgi:ABC-type transporter Mla MlaB component